MPAESALALDLSRALHCHDFGMNGAGSAQRPIAWEEIFVVPEAKRQVGIVGKMAVATTLLMVRVFGCPGDEIMAGANGLLPHTEDTGSSPNETNQLVGLFYVDPRKEMKISIENPLKV